MSEKPQLTEAALLDFRKGLIDGGMGSDRAFRLTEIVRKEAGIAPENERGEFSLQPGVLSDMWFSGFGDGFADGFADGYAAKARAVREAAVKGAAS